MKRIAHIDMNSFFVSCELKEFSDVGNLKLVISGDVKKRNGVISAASYSARAIGIDAGMSTIEALKIYPNLIVRSVDMQKYKDISKELMDFIREEFKYSEQASIDEAYIDISQIICKYGNEYNWAKKIQIKIKNKFNLPCSIGIGDNKYQAKMASNYKKPEGITIVNTNNFLQIFGEKDLKYIHGLGKASQELYYRNGIKTINDIANYDVNDWRKQRFREEHYQKSHGLDDGQIDTKRYLVHKSVSNEKTLPFDIQLESEVFEEFNKIFERAYNRMIDDNYMCKVVNIKVKYDNFSQSQKSFTINNYSSDKHMLKITMEQLIVEMISFEKKIRLIAVGFSSLIKKDDYEKKYSRYFEPFKQFYKGDKDEQ